MSADPTLLREHARSIWQAGVDAVRPEDLIRRVLADSALGIQAALDGAQGVVVFGGGKAGTAMAAGLETALDDFQGEVKGIVNVPADTVRPLRWIQLHAARPASVNHPTPEGVEGTRHILEVAKKCSPRDVGFCLLSGGGSALLPAPVLGISLEDKQRVTQLLHASGATINEMNAVRKHLSAIKGGRLAQAFAGKALFSLIISDVVGDPLDVIASGPTAADPTTFEDAVAILYRYHLAARVPASVLEHLRAGAAGKIAETPKSVPAHVHNCVIGNNTLALAAAQRRAEELGYSVINLGAYIEGETHHVAAVLAGIVRSIRRDAAPARAPACILAGGETTVTLTDGSGKGGRNQELVLAMLCKLGEADMRDVIALSGGTDGEDGPTDAAGAMIDQNTLNRALGRGLKPEEFLERHDAYPFFSATGDLLITGLTQTNVMDLRVMLIV